MTDQRNQTKSGMLLGGIFASEAIDTANEQLLLNGMDISEIEQGFGVANYEHNGSTGNGTEIVGKIVYVKKIYGPNDCANERQLECWNKLELPFLYGIVRLYDGAGHEGARALAAQVRDHVAHGEPILARFSIEGTTLEREGQILKRTVARKVAITLKPANRSCDSQLLSDPNAPEGYPRVFKGENTHPDEVLLGVGQEASLEDEESLAKTLEAGGYDARPSSLTQGAALQVEDRSLKNRIKSAFRDWNRVKPLAKYLKEQLPEISDEFINKFVDALGPLTIKKSLASVFTNGLQEQLLAKMMGEGKPFKAAGFRDPHTGKISTEPNEDWAPGYITKSGGFLLKSQAAKTVTILDISHGPLSELLNPRPWDSATGLLEKFEAIKESLQKKEGEPVSFQGKTVIPGTGKTVDGKEYDILGHTNTHFVVVPKGQAINYQPHDLHKVTRGPDFHVKSFPKDQTAPAIVQPEHVLSPHPDANALAVGLDLDGPKSHRTTDADSSRGFASFWTKSPNNKHVYVKEDLFDRGEAENEAAFHNLAKDFFGLGQYVPSVAAIQHPQTGQKMTVVEGVDGEHPDQNPQSETSQKLLQLGDSGVLNKLAVMDTLLHNGDRHDKNYLVTNDGMKLIDHGLIFQPGYYDGRPEYLGRYQTLKNKSGQFHGDLDEATAQWVRSLNPQALEQHLRANGVAESDAQSARHRLESMHEYLNNPPIYEPAHGIENLLNYHTGARISREVPDAQPR